jgi:Skp family chaperone for outer membrane proteins
MITALVLTTTLGAGTAFAQATPPPPPPTTPPPAGQQPPPTGQKPTTPTPQTPAPKPAAEPVPFPEGAKLAFVDLQRVVENSVMGKAGSEQLKKLSDKLGTDLAAKNKEIQALQAKINSQKGVASADSLNGWLKELDRMQRQAQFDQQNAQVEIEAMNRQLLESFQVKVLPLIEALRKEKDLWMIFALGDNSPIAAAHAGLDLTADLIKRLDAVK